MASAARQRGFSMAEVLIAIGILAVAMIFIAGVFPVGIRFTQVSIDRTTAAIAANEAFAKIQLCAAVLPSNLEQSKIKELSFTEQRDFNDWFYDLDNTRDYLVDANMFSYPTDGNINYAGKQYFWKALLRSLDRNLRDPNYTIPRRDVQVTVFVCRRAGPAAEYYQCDVNDFSSNFYGQILDTMTELPQPVRIEVRRVFNRANELQFDKSQEKTLINDGDLIVDDRTGRIYRVMERYKYPKDDIILLDKDFNYYDAYGDSFEFDRKFVWVVPSGPPVGGQRGIVSNFWNVGGKRPCVGIYQKVIRF